MEGTAGFRVSGVRKNAAGFQVGGVMEGAAGFRICRQRPLRKGED